MNKAVLTAAAALVAGAAIYMTLPDRTTDMPAVETARSVAVGSPARFEIPSKNTNM